GLATAYSENRRDTARAYVTTSLAMLSAVTLLIGVVIAAVWPWIDWTAIFNVRGDAARSEVGPAMAVALVLFLLSFPFSLITKILIAHQEGKIANYWGATGNVASLIALIVVTQTQGGLVWLVLAVSGAGLAVEALSGVWLFVWHKPWLAPHPAA